MPKLTATPEMKQAAIADEPKQHEGPYGYRYVERTYYPYMNCVVQDGILKAAFYLPEHLRLDGNNPAYEVFLDKKAHQFLTYDHLEKKWRDAKLDRLNWPGRNYYATCWASEKDAAVVQDYLCGERGGDLGILVFRERYGTNSWSRGINELPARGIRIWLRCLNCPRIGRAGLIRWLCGKISSSIAINAAEPKRLLYLLWERGPYIRASISQ